MCVKSVGVIGDQKKNHTKKTETVVCEKLGNRWSQRKTEKNARERFERLWSHR